MAAPPSSRPEDRTDRLRNGDGISPSVSYNARVIPAFLLALQASPILLNVDATEIDRGVVRVDETIPTSGGKRGFYFPKFIPGEHRASGPINYLVALHFFAGGKEIEWNRDPVDLYRFVVDVPRGASTLEARFAMLSEFRQPGQVGRGNGIAEGMDNATPNLARVKWNRLLLYPEGRSTDRILVQPKLTPPVGWSVASALQPGSVSVTELVDSPAMVGRYYKAYDLGSIGGAPVGMDVMAEEDGPQNIPEAQVARVKELVRQQGLLFGGRHFRRYRFLITLSDAGAGEGLEHHECSEDGTGLRAGVNGTWGELLAHEMTHSWNGKYRRPEGLATPDFDKPMDGSGLWVYEGLTQYLGYVQAARSGFGTPERWRGTWTGLVRNFDEEPGRAWRPVVDTARSVGLLRGAGGPWAAERRGTEYYTEGALVWLEADCVIREGTGGKKSLDDFCRLFHGGTTDAPRVVPYGTAEIVRDLNRVYAYDWARFLHERIDLVRPGTPDEALARAGYRLAAVVPSAEEPTAPPRGGRGGFGGTNLKALGMTIGRDGTVSALAIDGPALKAGLAPGTTIAKMDGQPFDAAALAKKVATPGPGTVALETSRGPVTLAYVGAPAAFRLEPIPGKPDLLDAIAKPLP